MRLNKKPANIVLTRKEKGGVHLNIAPGCELIDTDEETIEQILKEYRVHNCHLAIRSNATAEDIINVIEGNGGDDDVVGASPHRLIDKATPNLNGEESPHLNEKKNTDDLEILQRSLPVGNTNTTPTEAMIYDRDELLTMFQALEPPTECLVAKQMRAYSVQPLAPELAAGASSAISGCDNMRGDGTSNSTSSSNVLPHSQLGSMREGISIGGSPVNSNAGSAAAAAARQGLVDWIPSAIRPQKRGSGMSDHHQRDGFGFGAGVALDVGEDINSTAEMSYRWQQGRRRKNRESLDEGKGEGTMSVACVFEDGAEKAQAQTENFEEDWDLSEPFIFEEEEDDEEEDNFPSFVERLARKKERENENAAYPSPIPVDFQPQNRRVPPPFPPPSAPAEKSMKDSPPDHFPTTAARGEQKDPIAAQSSEARPSSRTPLVPTAPPFTPTLTAEVTSFPINRQLLGAAAATPDAAAKDTQHFGENNSLILTAIGNNLVGSGSGNVVTTSFLPTSPATPAGSAFTSSPCSSPEAAGKTSSHAPYPQPRTPTTPVRAADLSTILYRTFDPTEDVQEKAWRYRDPQGVEQGPFSTAEMQHWNNLGYFSSVLPVQYKGVGPFFPLSSLFPENVLPFRGQMVEITPELLAEVEERAPVNNNQGPTQEWVSSLAHNQQGQDSNTMLGLTSGGGPFDQNQLGLNAAAAAPLKGGNFFGADGSYNIYSNQSRKSVNQLPHARDHDGSKGQHNLHSHSREQKSVNQQHIIGIARRPGSAKGQQQNMRNAQKSGGSSSSMNPSQQGDNRNVLGGGSTVYKGYLEEAKNEQQTSNLKGLLGLNTNSYEETTGHGGLKARGGSQGGGDQNQYLNQGQGQGQYSQGQFQAQFLGQGQFQGHQGHQGQYSQGKSRDGRTPGQIQHQGQYQALGGQGQYQQGKGMGKDKDHGQRYGQTQYYLTPQDPAYMQEGHHQQFQQSHKIVMGPHDVGGGIAQLNPNQNRENKRGGNNTAKRERRRQKEKEDPYANSGYFVDGGNPSTALLQQPPLSGTTHSPPPHSSDLGRKQHGMVAPIDYSSHSHVQHHPPGGFLGATADGGDYTARRKPSILNPTEFPSLSAQSPSGGGSSTLQSDHLKSPTQQQQKPPEPEGFWERPPRPPPVVEPIEVSSPVKPTAASTTTAVSLYAPLNGSSNSPTLHVVDSSSKPNPPDALNAPESKKQQEQKELDEKAKAPRKKREKGKTVDPKLLGFVARPRGVT